MATNSRLVVNVFVIVIIEIMTVIKLIMVIIVVLIIMRGGFASGQLSRPNS